MRLEPLLTLEIREKIRRAVSELNDIEAILESMGDFTQPVGVYQDVVRHQRTIIHRVADAIELIAKAHGWLLHMRDHTDASHDITFAEFEALHKP